MRVIGEQLLVMVLMSLLGVAASAASPSSKAPDTRPVMADYEDPDEFVRDVLAWERHQRNNNRHDETERNKQTADSGDWHDINGPEKLDEALQKAYGYTPPNYKAQYRFNRTTHLSFPLPRLESNQMSGQAITGALRDATDSDERSLKPLPELHSILQEADQSEDVSVAPRQTPQNTTSAQQHSIRLRAR